ncbi:MAG TPA: alanine--tRNA ligase, partial [Rhabdochlamydiaceae bacterium]|nr:alanine--tRNA ligase [Rhabdochlamydiaceae bacterium]
MLSQETRRKFLHYFKQKGHAIVPSSPVVPHDDPTLLFTNAGMNQFKDVFLGKSVRDYKRATTSQKCIRVGGKHNDLDNVGHTSRHLTFFEMLGNFSFGDYFKEKAIEYAWEVATEIFEFPAEKIWPTVFEKDEEAYVLWQKYVPEKRIMRMGEKDNFWAMGDTGPCGPSSELLFDRGEKYGKAKNPKEDLTGERFLEFWNLVFMQFNRDATGKFTPLPNQSIDTGAGLERIISLKMHVDNVFLIDIFQHIIRSIEKVSHKKYSPENQQTAPAFHVIADHLRSLAFAIADGAQPSNVERGYVLRKLLRRAVRYGKVLELGDPFLARILPALVETMGDDYPELVSAGDRIAEVLTLEEEQFYRTLKRGGNILNGIIEKSLKSSLKQITGEDAFKLKDTYGFPLEEILLIAKDTGLQVNMETFQLLEEKAKETSRGAHSVHGQEAEENLFKSFAAKNGPSKFVGYTDTESESRVIGIVKNNQFVQSLNEHEEGMILLDKTPFYAEKGGQIADIGTLTHEKARFKVTQCQNPLPGVIVHIGKMEHGFLSLGETVLARIDEKRRQGIANHHTATHLLHLALQKILGSHIRQAGSLVEEKRLRFDFNHHKALSLEEIRQIEDFVNDKIREDRTIKTYELSFEEAQKKPEIKQFFGEKYGKSVRVVDIEDSKELCGGTHTAHTGTIGYFRITKEMSVAAGVRRIEAVSGKAAEEFARKHEDLLNESAAILKTTPSKLVERAALLLEENEKTKKEMRALKSAGIELLAKEL